MRWSSLNTRPELAEAARRLRQLSCSRRAEIGMHGSQAVRSLLIGFSRARAARVARATRAFSVAHRRIRLRRPRTQPHTARPRHCRGFEPTRVQLARCNAEATTQALAHQECQRTLSGLPLATATVQQAPQPASATCLVRLLRSAATPSRPPVPGPLAS